MLTPEIFAGRQVIPSADEPLPAEQIVVRYHGYDVSRHPFFVRLARGPVDLTAVWTLMANLNEGISAHFTRWLARTIERIEDRRITSLLAKQLNDELGEGHFEQIHSVLLDRFVAALSPWRPAGTDETLLRAGRRMAASCGQPFSSADPFEGVGALIVGEIFAEKMDLCLANEMRRQSLVQGETMAWLDLHEKLEHEHAQDSIELAILVPKERSLLVAAWRGAASQWDALWQFLDDVDEIVAVAREKASSQLVGRHS
jgi:pyrroloquinoline quinone (PQQ) biosynthesis protein C